MGEGSFQDTCNVLQGCFLLMSTNDFTQLVQILSGSVVCPSPETFITIYTDSRAVFMAHLGGNEKMFVFKHQDSLKSDQMSLFKEEMWALAVQIILILYMLVIDSNGF